MSPPRNQPSYGKKDLMGSSRPPPPPQPHLRPISKQIGILECVNRAFWLGELRLSQEGPTTEMALSAGWVGHPLLDICSQYIASPSNLSVLII